MNVVTSSFIQLLPFVAVAGIAAAVVLFIALAMGKKASKGGDAQGIKKHKTWVILAVILVIVHIALVAIWWF